MSITDLLTTIFVPGIIIGRLKKHNPKRLGYHFADITDEALDAEFRQNRSEIIQKELVPFIKAFSDAYCERLLADQSKGEK